MQEELKTQFDIGASGTSYKEKYGFYSPEDYAFKSKKGLGHEVVEEISWMKNEPDWMRQFRHRALDIFYKKPMPQWGGDLSTIDFNDIYYFVRAIDKQGRSWDEIPSDIKNTFDKLGIPEAEQKFLSGVGAQYESESVYHHIKESLTKQGVIFVDTDTALREYPDLFRKYFGTIIPPADNKLAALNSAVWSGGCLTADARVFTTNPGAKSIAEVRAGDTVFALSPEGKLVPAQVLAHVHSGQKPVYRFRAAGRTLEATGNHMFLTLEKSPVRLDRYGRKWSMVWKPLEELQEGAIIAIAKRIPSQGPGDTHACRITGNVALLDSRNPHHRAVLDNADKHTFDKYTTVTGENFSALASEDIGFAPIREKEYIGVRDVYDIQVDGFANFVANGIIAHNSFIYVPPGVHVEMPLQAYFRINAQNMGQFERTMIVVDEGAFVHYVEGCFLAGARVRTRNGEKAIEEIQAGDEVLTHKGRYRQVYHTLRRPYRGPVYHIRYWGDSSQTLHVTEEHPLLVVRRECARERNKLFEPQWLSAAQVKPGDYLAIPIPQPKVQKEPSYRITTPIGRGRHAPAEREVEFPFEPDLFRLIGYYHAEGHVDNEHYPSFSFNAQETAYLQDVSTLAQIGADVYEKRVPEWVQSAPRELLAQWVRGAWRGDGSYDARGNMFRYNTVSRELAYAFRDALLRLGIVASVNVQPRDEPREDIYAVVISSPWNAQFGEIVGRPAPNGSASGSPFYLDQQYLYAPIRAIEIEKVDTIVYNFSVEEDESYIGEGVVSHNCTAPIYTTDSLHSAVVEILVMKGARARYTTIQNWSNNVYNLVTKRAVAKEDATMEWVDANLGCLEQGSTVTTPDGIKPIEELQVGARVLSYDEQTGELCFRRVLGKRFSGYQPVHTVSVGERKLRVTANHPFYSYVYAADAPKKLGRYRLAYVRADHLKEAIVPRVSLAYGEPHRLLTPPLVTEFSSRNPQAARLSPYLSPTLRQRVEESPAAQFEYHRTVDRPDIALPETVQVVKVNVSSPSDEAVPTWDIQVEGSGNFISQGFIVHNSKLTMKYPSIYLMGKGAHGEVLSVAFAGKGQHQDAGGKAVHGAPHTSSQIISKSISKDGGRTSYRGLLKVYPGCEGVKANVRCDALLLDEQSRSDTYPYIEVDEDDVAIGHEASVSKIGEEQLFYLMSRGLSETEAATMIVGGFIEPIVKELPMEYSIELNRLVALQMEGSVG